METFAILSARDLLHEESSPERCEELLRGIPFQALVQYASVFCHNLTVAGESGAGSQKLFEFHDQFVRNHASVPFYEHLKTLLSHRRAYRGKDWALTDEHRVASLVLAYARANVALPPGETGRQHLDRLLHAQLVVNDLVSLPTEGPLEELPVATVLRSFAMARAWNARSTMPRGFNVMVAGLLKSMPEIAGEVRAYAGVDLEEIAIVLFGLYLNLFGAVPGVPWAEGQPKPRWSRGLLDLSKLGLRHSGEAVMRTVFDKYARPWDDLYAVAAGILHADPSIVPLFDRPLIRTGGEQVWCFDPGMVLNAATLGLAFLAARAHEAAQHEGQAVFSALGHAFEAYLALFFQEAGCHDVQRGDEQREGLSDFYLLEGDTLIAIEAKASLMRDDAKWSGDEKRIRGELQKLVKDNQLMKAIARKLESDPNLRGRVTRVVPVFVVLDPVFACPGLEPEVIAAVAKPDVAVGVEDPHLLFVGALETAGNYLREGLFSKLLDARRAVAGTGWVGLDELIGRYKTRIEAALGGWLEPFDAHVGTRADLNTAMREFWLRHGGAAGGPPGITPDKVGQREVD